jgi:hypothetical protein
MGIDTDPNDDKFIYPSIRRTFLVDNDDSNDADGEGSNMTPLQQAWLKIKLKELSGDSNAFWEACHEPRHILLRTLLREVVAGTPNGERILQLPSQVKTNLLREVIVREFRVDAMASEFDLETRQTVAIMAWQVLNMRLAHAEPLIQLQYESDLEQMRLRNEKQTALHVAPLPLDPLEYLNPGTFLVAHPLAPLMARREVICILEHIEGSNESGDGTYGLVVNRLATSDRAHGVLRGSSRFYCKVPLELAEPFGDSIVYEGGDVHMSWQMVSCEVLNHWTKWVGMFCPW